MLLSCFALTQLRLRSSTFTCAVWLRHPLATALEGDIPQRIRLTSHGHSLHDYRSPNYEYYVFFILRSSIICSFPALLATGPRLFGYIHILDPSDLARVISSQSHVLHSSAFVGDYGLTADEPRTSLRCSNP